MRLDAHTVTLDLCEGENHVYIRPADPGSVVTVLDAGVDDPDGRSQFLWIRLGNGDLILGVYPQGDTYFATEEDHSF